MCLPAGAAAKGGKGEDDDTVLRTYVVTYSGSWHRQGYLETETSTGVERDDFTDDANWNLRSTDKPIKIRTSRRNNFGSVTGGVLAQEMEGAATRTQVNTSTCCGTSSNITDGPDILDASLAHDEGTDKQHALGVSGLDYGSYGDKNREVYPMPIDGRHPRKGYSFPISGSQTTSEPGFEETARIDATWTLELARKKRLD
jgi:hypothetical protein